MVTPSAIAMEKETVHVMERLLLLMIVWVDTIKEGRFDDTNKMFVKPDKFDFHVTTQDAKNWAPKILKEIK